MMSSVEQWMLGKGESSESFSRSITHPNNLKMKLLTLFSFLGTVLPFQASSISASSYSDVFLSADGSPELKQSTEESPAPYSSRYWAAVHHRARPIPLVLRRKLLVRYSYAPTANGWATTTPQPILRGGSSSTLPWKSLALGSFLLSVAGWQMASLLSDAAYGISSPFRILQSLGSVSFWTRIAPPASIALKLSPLPSILRIARQQSTDGLPLLPYSAMCTLTFSMILYGLLVQDSRIVATHTAGHALSLLYCAVYIRNCQSPRQDNPARVRGGGTARVHLRWGTGVAASLVAAIVLWGRAAAPIVGSTAAVLSCLMYAGPLVQLQDALRARSARSIPLPYAIAGSVNAIAWTVYGYCQRGDWMVWVPSVIGLFSAVLQILINVVY